MSSDTSKTRPAVARRAWEWLWRRQALGAARVRQAEQGYALACQQRARIALEVGQRTLDPSTPLAAGSASHLAAGLFIEAIGWALRVPGAAKAMPAPYDLKPADPPELRELTTTHRELLLSAAGDPELAARTLEQLLERRFQSSAPSPAEAEQTARELGKVAHALQHAVAPREDDLDTLYFQRFSRVGSCVLAVLALVLGFFALKDALERKSDVSLGKPWSASSSYEQVCVSPQHECPVKKSYFFHTQEEANPWLEIDLQGPLTVSGVRVDNREDCCAERAAPLVVEVSTDRAHWREVARRTDVFSVWKAHFSPVTARYVRFRVAGRAILHLADVRVLK